MRDILYVKIMFLVEKVFLYLRFAPNLQSKTSEKLSKTLIIQLTVILFELSFELLPTSSINIYIWCEMYIW